jgi:hypothetical protein
MTKYSSSTEKCATCDYWAGPRELINYGRYVQVDNDARGSCNCPGSTSRRLDNKPAVFTCPQWSKWGALR